MPFSFLIPLAMGAMGAMSGLGRSGKQGTLKQSEETSTRKSITEDLAERPWEAEYWTQFRQQLLPVFMQALGQAAQPVYGDAQKALVIQQANDLQSKALQAAKNSLARLGLLDSGTMADAATALEAQRASSVTDFLLNLPMMERQAQMGQLLPMLQLGAQWAGAAPLGRDVQASRLEESLVKAMLEQTQSGPAWWKAMLGGFGEGFGAGSLLELIGQKKKTSQPGQTGG